MSRVSETEIKRWALDTSDWIWGTAQGAFNEKQTTSQIIVDAVIGMIWLVVCFSLKAPCAVPHSQSEASSAQRLISV